MMRLANRTAFGRGGPPLAPAWLPAAGSIVDVSTNTINDVKGSDTSTPAIFNAWSGVAWAPWWGDYGSMLFSGGGHSDGMENSVYRYDVGTQLISKIIEPATSYVYGIYNADPITGWMWANTSGSAVQEGQPFAAHFYSHLMALPASAFPGDGGVNGYLYTPSRTAMALDGNNGTNQPQKLRLGLDTLWTHAGLRPGFSAENGFGVYDSLRNRVWSLKNDTALAFDYRDLTAGTFGSATHTGPNAGGYYCVGGYHAAEDCVMYARMLSSTLILGVFDPVTNVFTKPSSSGVAPTGSDGAFDWSDVWNAWVYWPGNGGNTVYFLKAPANPRTGTWVWSSQTVTGISRVGTTWPQYNRIRHCAALGDVLLWVPNYNVPMQGIHVTAP